ncbi:TonB C-terminal domain-containing protein [Qipengyuania sp.]|uniref:TonB C-terminal domain-containing protein n=1 Tax=Qipengyuania sp. TaxID=2004515 RepID=UPI0035C7D559
MRREERIGLGIAAALHVALLGAFLYQPTSRVDMSPTQRMTVNLASEVGLEATAPEPVPESRAAIAPTIADTPEPAAEPAETVAEPQPQPAPQPRIERPVTTPARPKPADTSPRRRPDAPSRTAPKPAQKSTSTAQPKPAPKSGGTRLGDNFLAGMGDSASTSETRAPAAALGSSEKAAIGQAIARQLKPHWQPPSGADADQLITKVRFRLNRDGSLVGRPEVVGQSGVTDANRAQAGRHGELAVRAVQLAAPFDLPEQYYDGWKTVTAALDWRLSQ